MVVTRYGDRVSDVWGDTVVTRYGDRVSDGRGVQSYKKSAMETVVRWIAHGSPWKNILKTTEMVNLVCIFSII